MSPSYDLQGVRILYVDDDLDTLSLVDALLASRGVVAASRVH